ncbi:MAG: hypothetical protein ACTSRE_17135, partial [Promethearchaeota archaeon]
MILHTILFIVCLTWTIYAISNIVGDIVISDDWYNIFMGTLLVTPIAVFVFLSLVMKNSGLLRTVIRKQKGIEPKDREKYYHTPD